MLEIGVRLVRFMEEQMPILYRLMKTQYEERETYELMARVESYLAQLTRSVNECKPFEDCFDEAHKEMLVWFEDYLIEFRGRFKDLREYQLDQMEW